MTSILQYGNSLDFYDNWLKPKVIVSDGPYGLGIYPGETSDATTLEEFYRPHVEKWSQLSDTSTTLWFWNCELGFGECHQLLRQHGWDFQELVVWDKGISHIAGKVNSQTIKGLPVTTEVCARYTRPPAIYELPFKDWLRSEWKKSGLPFSAANIACGVKNAATRKWLSADHHWYMPRQKDLDSLQSYCKLNGKKGLDYFVLEGDRNIESYNPVWHHQHGVSNVWAEPPVRGSERLKVNGKSAHANQKPLSLMKRQILMSSDISDVIWEPFGGLCSASLAAKQLQRYYQSAEINVDYFDIAQARLR